MKSTNSTFAVILYSFSGIQKSTDFVVIIERNECNSQRLVIQMGNAWPRS